MWAEKNLASWFDERLKLECRADTRAYILGVLNDMRQAKKDLSQESLTLMYFRAVEKRDFALYQDIGDWVLWADAFAPQSLSEHALAVNLGRRSYYACWRMMRGEWVLYEELADRLPRLSEQVRVSLFSVQAGR